MVNQKNRGFLGEIEEKLHLPHLSQVAEVMEKFPDSKQLHQIKEVITAAEALAHNAVELDKVVALIREINCMPMEKLTQLQKILRQIEKIIKESPQDLMSFLTGLK